MRIADLAQDAYENAVEKGFHSNPDGTPKDRNIGEALALIHSEVSEALEEYRKNPDLKHKYYREKDGKPEGFVVELADIIIRVGDLVGGIDCVAMLEECIVEKMAFNATRPFMHGKTC